ncbi:hypothetical protein [Limnoraphis robusta]|uniref:Uncharacterized protein n=1 Tax=Limnoraphis robusta CS-951 TaxID=1637645 RepID=A0A0J9EW27_9CYAN|nr:hypothetical protein [Limnoraphis robusta]KMW70488.1 hypothetical protein WN50_34875 [Limnoraphis robusta CS-951]
MIESVTDFREAINYFKDSAWEWAEICTIIVSLFLGLIATFKLSFKFNSQPEIVLFLVISPVIFMSWRIEAVFENNVTHFMNIIIVCFSFPLIVFSLFKIFTKNLFNEIH